MALPVFRKRHPWLSLPVLACCLLFLLCTIPLLPGARAGFFSKKGGKSAADPANSHLGRNHQAEAGGRKWLGLRKWTPKLKFWHKAHDKPHSLADAVQLAKDEMTRAKLAHNAYLEEQWRTARSKGSLVSRVMDAGSLRLSQVLHSFGTFLKKKSTTQTKESPPSSGETSASPVAPQVAEEATISSSLARSDEGGEISAADVPNDVPLQSANSHPLTDGLSVSLKEELAAGAAIPGKEANAKTRAEKALKGAKKADEDVITIARKEQVRFLSEVQKLRKEIGKDVYDQFMKLLTTIRGYDRKLSSVDARLKQAQWELDDPMVAALVGHVERSKAKDPSTLNHLPQADQHNVNSFKDFLNGLTKEQANKDDRVGRDYSALEGYRQAVKDLTAMTSRGAEGDVNPKEWTANVRKEMRKAQKRLSSARGVDITLKRMIKKALSAKTEEAIQQRLKVDYESKLNQEKQQLDGKITDNPALENLQKTYQGFQDATDAITYARGNLAVLSLLEKQANRLKRLWLTPLRAGLIGAGVTGLLLAGLTVVALSVVGLNFGGDPLAGDSSGVDDAGADLGAIDISEFIKQNPDIISPAGGTTTRRLLRKQESGEE